MNKSLLGSLGLLGLVLVAGCGSDDEEKPADSTSQETLASYAEAACEAFARCDPQRLANFGGVARCPERYKLLFESRVAIPGTGYDDPAWIADCIDVARSASCSRLTNGGVIDCRTPTGTLGEGAACRVSNQCASMSCKYESGSSCGVCVPPAGLDEPCYYGMSCASGLHCADQFASDPLVCVEGDPKDGGAPNPPEEPKVGDKCDSYQTCGSKLRCHNGVCALPVEIGGACSGLKDCVSGAFCDPQEKVCAAIKLVGEGQACDVAGVACEDGLWCKGGAVCVAHVEDGATCEDIGADSIECLLPATCENSVCTVLYNETCQ